MRRGRGAEFERGMDAFERVFGFPPQSHAAAGWQINPHGLELEREFGLSTRATPAAERRSFRCCAAGAESVPADSDDAADVR